MFLCKLNKSKNNCPKILTMKKVNLLLIGLMLLAFACKKVETTDNTVVEKPAIDSAEIKRQDSIRMAKEAEAKLKAMLEKQRLADKGVDLNDKYQIVIASYTVEEFGKDTKQEMIDAGFKAKIFMLEEDGWYKLAIESYDNTSDAYNALQRIKDMGGVFTDARIVTKSK